MYFIYNILYFIVLVVILPYQYLKRPRALRGRWLRERCGNLTNFAPFRKRPIWIHSVSVGEVIASIPLLKGLKASYPDREIVLSTVTDTGQKVAAEMAGDLARIIYVPFDTTMTVANTFGSIRPALFIIMETELWPATIKFLGRRGVPVILMNGRISDRSVKGYRKLRFFFGKVLNEVSFFCMQNQEYAERIISLGADEKKVRAIGNFKFDTRPVSPVPEWTKLLDGPVIIAGSTHRTEEDIVIDAYIRLLSDYPALNLIIAPRHPERFREVEEILKRRAINYVKRSEIDRGEAVPHPHDNDRAYRDTPLQNTVVLLDVMGELSSVYGAADIAVMGGSFIEHGGQNPLEPAFWGKAIVCGPHMENFPFIDEFYRNGAAAEAERDDLYAILKDILDSPERMQRMGQLANELYGKNAGATAKAIETASRFLINP